MSGGPPTISDPPLRDGHAARQWNYFRDADGAKFRWQTHGPMFVASERRLVLVAAGDGSPLEVGSG
jgi:hypothetical protein